MGLNTYTQTIKCIVWEGGQPSKDAVTAALKDYAQVVFDSGICFIIPRGHPQDHLLVQLGQHIVMAPVFGVYTEEGFHQQYPGAVKQSG